MDKPELPADKRSLEFSSENFKIEVSNLPKKFKFHQAKQIFQVYYKLEPHKIKLAAKRAYLTFKSEDERDNALDVLNRRDWKGCSFEAKLAAPNDRFLSKFKPENDTEFESNPTLINDRVCPLWNKSYEDQLIFKENSMKQVLNFKKKLLELCKDVKLDKTAPDLHKWIHNRKDKMCCDFQGVVASPVLVGYRNKCEFNVDQNGTVGFKLGRYKDGSERVYFPPDNCPLLNQKMFELLKAFQQFLRNENKQTKLTGFNPITHEGNVRQITLRTNEAKQSMVIIDLDPQDLTKEELDLEIANIISLFKSIEGVVTIYMNISTREHNTSSETLRLVYGESHIVESLKIGNESALKFLIGATSFFQINTKAAQLLYESIIDLAKLNSNSLVLDLGSGIGSIGLSLARRVAWVVGIEISSAAVADAKLNSKENNIENVLFFAGRVEDLVGEAITILRQKQSGFASEIVAIVDPPRGGFANSFVKKLRATPQIKTIIYVACDPLANQNLIDLCRPTSKNYQNDPFVPVAAKAFDLFPFTKFCELVLVYERLVSSSRLPQASELVTTETTPQQPPATTTTTTPPIEEK